MFISITQTTTFEKKTTAVESALSVSKLSRFCYKIHMVGSGPLYNHNMRMYVTPILFPYSRDDQSNEMLK